MVWATPAPKNARSECDRIFLTGSASVRTSTKQEPDLPLFEQLRQQSEVVDAADSRVITRWSDIDETVHTFESEPENKVTRIYASLERQQPSPEQLEALQFIATRRTQILFVRGLVRKTAEYHRNRIIFGIEGSESAEALGYILTHEAAHIIQYDQDDVLVAHRELEDIRTRICKGNPSCSNMVLGNLSLETLWDLVHYYAELLANRVSHPENFVLVTNANYPGLAEKVLKDPVLKLLPVDFLWNLTPQAFDEFRNYVRAEINRAVTSLRNARR